MLVKCKSTGKEYDASRFWLEVERMEGDVYYFLYCEYRSCHGSVRRLPLPLRAFHNQEWALKRLDELQEALELEKKTASAVAVLSANTGM